MKQIIVKVNYIDNVKITNITKIAEISDKDVHVGKGHVKVDAKSILGVLSLGMRVGDEITFYAEEQNILDTLSLQFQ